MLNELLIDALLSVKYYIFDENVFKHNVKELKQFL